jgi:hypothetical protein
MLLRARAALVRCEYARWQVERLEECDKQINSLDLARTDYERLKARYTQARDHYRALRLRLRRQYYSHLREDGGTPSPVSGIEGKVEELIRAAPLAPEAAQLGETLSLVHTAQGQVSSHASEYCAAHNTLHNIIEDSRHQAQALESLAYDMLRVASAPKRKPFADDWP